jgi:hypothetical protein
MRPSYYFLFLGSSQQSPNVSVDQFSQNIYIPINSSKGGGVDISLFSRKKAWGEKETFVKYSQSQG